MQNHTQLFLVLTVLTGFLYSLIWLKPSKNIKSDFLPPNFSPEEVQVADEKKVLGDDIEKMVEGTETKKLKERLQDDLKDVLGQSEGYDTEEISDAIENGSWTENRTASAFLSDKQNFSLKERFLGLVYENRSQQRLEKTLEAMKESYYQKGQKKT